MLHNVFIRNAETMSVVMPWEKGVAKTIFSKGRNSFTFPKQQLKGWVQTADHLLEDTVASRPTMVEAPSTALSGALFERALSVVTDQNFLEKRQEALDLAIDKWFSIIRINLLGSEVGQTIIGHGGNIQEQKLGAYETIEAIIGVRSRTTAISRANALLKFFRWRADFTEDDGKPVTEQAAWNYVARLRADGAAPTRASSFLAACGYALHVFGFKDFDSVYNSRRVRGLAEIMHSGKSPLKQAKVLSVAQVLALHNLMENRTANFIDRALAAYALLALYGRCRHSDLAFVDCVMHDFDERGGFVEVSTRLHKTAKSASQKSQLLPIVIPAVGVTGQVWVQEAIEAFSACGLTLDGAIQGPLFRPPMAAGGGLCKRGLTSSEVTKFLRLLFENNENNTGEPRVSSHSLKATALSWASKFGLPIPDKAILGRHASATTEAHAIYSRDLSVASVMKLQDIILRISRLEFQPDNPRRGYFAEESNSWAVLNASEVVKVEEESPSQEVAGGEIVLDEECISDHQGSSSDSSSEGSSSSEEEVRPPPPKSYKHAAKGHLTGRFVIHKTSKLVHYKDSVVGVSKADGKSVLSCGRALNSNYEIVVNFDTVALCRRCKVNAVKDGLLPQV
jgi:integrase